MPSIVEPLPITGDTPISIEYRGGTISLPLVDFFNPRKNTVFSLNAGNFNLGDFWGILKSLYTRENLQKYPDLYLAVRESGTFTGHLKNTKEALPAYQDTTIGDLLSDIPDSHLPYLFFFQFHFNGDYFYCFNPDPHIDGSDLFVYTNQRKNVRITRNTPEFLKELLKVHLVDCVTAFQRYSLSTLIMSVNAGHPVIESIVQYIRNSHIGILRYEGTNPRPSDLLQIEDFTITVSNRPGGALHCLNVNEVYNAMSRKHLYRIFSYSQSPSEKITGNAGVLSKEISPRKYGVELESCSDLTPKQIIDAQVEPFFICKEDSSISGRFSTRAELVTVPCSMPYLRLHWARWFNNIDYKKLDTTTSTNNGMHVHIAKTNFDDTEHVKRLTWFINNPSNSSFIVDISERGSRENMNQFTRLVSFNEGQRKVASFKSITSLAAGRGAVNLSTNKPTIEIRIFKGIMSYASVLKNLDFVEAVLLFTKECTFQQCYVKPFIEWLGKTNKNQYQGLKLFLKQMPLQQHINESIVREHTFNMTNPMEIRKVIERKKIPVDLSTIPLFNVNGGRISQYDQTLASRYTH